MGKKNPAKARNALLVGPIKVANLTLHPMTLGTVLLLEEIDSPLVLDGKKLGKAFDIINLVYILSRPAKESLALISKSKDAFRAEVLKMAESILPSDLEELGAAVQKIYEESFAPAIAFGGAEKKTSPKNSKN